MPVCDTIQRGTGVAITAGECADPVFKVQRAADTSGCLFPAARNWTAH
jgi:hypothetical protein